MTKEDQENIMFSFRLVCSLASKSTEDQRTLAMHNGLLLKTLNALFVKEGLSEQPFWGGTFSPDSKD